MEKLSPNRAQLFVRNKYTVFTMGSIVALRSINKFFSGELQFCSYSEYSKKEFITQYVYKKKYIVSVLCLKLKGLRLVCVVLLLSPSESCTCTCMLYEIVS